MTIEQEFTDEEIWVAYCPSDPARSRHYTNRSEAVHAIIHDCSRNVDVAWFLCEVQHQLTVIKLPVQPPESSAPHE